MYGLFLRGELLQFAPAIDSLDVIVARYFKGLYGRDLDTFACEHGQSWAATQE